MKHSHIGNFALKIAILTSCILVFLQVVFLLFSGGNMVSYAKDENAGLYQSAYSANIGNVGVALSTRIGLQYDSISKNISGNIAYKGSFNTGENSEEKKAIRSQMISQNMKIIRAYLNLSRTDVKSILDSSSDRKKTLESFISELEIRYKNSAISIQNLEKQKQLLLNEIQKIELQINSTKTKMESDFSSANSNATLADVDEYFVLRKKYTESFTDIVFMNQFLRQHAFLNNYNKGILDTLINNKQAIINQSYVVIPDSGDQYLRPLDLIFDEAEIKSKKTSQ